MKNSALVIDDIDIVLFDLDGTVYYGSRIIAGANETIRFFREKGKKIYFATNNSTKTRKQIYGRLMEMGVGCKFEEIITSGYLAALYAKRNCLENLYIFCSHNLIGEFTGLGITINQEETAENLLIGYNPDMTYEGLTSALQVALHAKCIMACNREKVYPGENARLMPGCGAMTAPIEWCSGRKCDMVIGKPNTLMVELIMAENRVGADRILVIGDTYESDIEMAKRAGCKSVLLGEPSYHDVLTVKSIREIPQVF